MLKLNKKCIIAIDGGAGVGKTTVSKSLSKNLGIVYIDTGAMYRASALYFLINNIEITDENILKNIDKINIDLRVNGENNTVILNGEDVTDKIRTEEVSMAASIVSKNRNLRKKLVEEQRKIAGNVSVVIEGRDTTTVVFPNADLKLFLTSNINTRAKRRFDDLKDIEKMKTTVDIVKEDMIKRDVQDSTREDSPLTKVVDAIEIDTTNNTVEDTTNVIINILKEKGMLV